MSSEINILTMIIEIKAQLIFSRLSRIEDVFYFNIKRSRASFQRYRRYHNMAHIFRKRRELSFDVFLFRHQNERLPTHFLLPFTRVILRL
jgi:hypothetical protein